MKISWCSNLNIMPTCYLANGRYYTFRALQTQRILSFDRETTTFSPYGFLCYTTENCMTFSRVPGTAGLPHTSVLRLDSSVGMSFPVRSLKVTVIYVGSCRMLIKVTANVIRGAKCDVASCVFLSLQILFMVIHKFITEFLRWIFFRKWPVPVEKFIASCRPLGYRKKMMHIGLAGARENVAS